MIAGIGHPNRIGTLHNAGFDFVSVLADALGSVGVIISSLLVGFALY
jgi:Co/Zn/Cd efflux system component